MATKRANVNSVWITGLLIAGLPLGAGCGRHSGPQRLQVSGKVTWQGKPVLAGVVTFTPDPKRGNSGPQGVATIHNGYYSTSGRNCRGPVGGPQIVTVIGCDPDKKSDLYPNGEPLFSAYQTDADLSQSDTTLDLDVPGS
jgi:hypothetical protein